MAAATGQCLICRPPTSRRGESWSQLAKQLDSARVDLLMGICPFCFLSKAKKQWATLGTAKNRNDLRTCCMLHSFQLEDRSKFDLKGARPFASYLWYGIHQIRVPPNHWESLVCFASKTTLSDFRGTKCANAPCTPLACVAEFPQYPERFLQNRGQICRRTAIFSWGKTCWKPYASSISTIATLVNI